jgi:hypothetical protein
MTGLSLQLLRPAALLLPMLLIGIPGALADSSTSPINAQTSPISAPARSPAEAHHACADILGLDPSQSPYVACVTSLQSCAVAAQLTELTEARRSTCAQEGFAPGTPAFAICVVQKEGAGAEVASSRR